MQADCSFSSEMHNGGKHRPFSASVAIVCQITHNTEGFILLCRFGVCLCLEK